MPEPGEVAPARGRLGPIALTALVIGNMVGSGVFLLPSTLAPYGGASVLGWAVSAVGSMLLGLALARLARRRPAAGGPYAYTRDAFGEFAGFQVGWGYWISCWTGVAALAIATVGYLGDLVPAVLASPFAASATAIGAIVLLCAINVSGVRRAGGVQVVTVVLKLLPLFAIAVFGFARFEPEHFRPFNPSPLPLFGAVQACLAQTLWAFTGFESASVAAGEARNPERDVPRATLLGIGLATVLYVVCTVAVMGLVPREVLVNSNAPFADAARELWGSSAGKLVAAVAFVSCFGALNGWILVSGRMPLAIARDGLFPRFFQRLSRSGTPAQGLVLSCALACAMVVANTSGSLVAMYNAMIVLATLSALVPLVFAAMAEALVSLRERRAGAASATAGIVIGFAAFGYGLLVVGGAGHVYVYWGFLLILSGLPFYVVARARPPAG